MISPDGSLETSIDQVLDGAVAERRTVGAAVMVARGGERVYARAAGLADREADVPFRLDTIVRFASVSKLFVAVAALRLVDRGALCLDEPVTTWLPDFRPILPDGREAIILVRHLLTHTSGLGYRAFQPAGSPYDLADVSDGLDLPGHPLEDNLARIAAQPLLAPPGTAFIYSVSIDVLGGVIQAATGRSLPESVRSLVTEPCGIRDTGFAVTDVDRLAAQYRPDSPRPRRIADGEVVTDPAMGDAVGLRLVPSRALDPAAFPSGGAGMVGVTDGILALLETVRLDAVDGAERLLARQTARSLFQGQIGDLAFEPGRTISFAGSVVTDPVLAGTPQSAGTLGWGGAYGLQWFIDPVREVSVIVATNTMFESPDGLFITDVRDAVYRVFRP